MGAARLRGAGPRAARRARRASVRARAGRETRRRSTAATARVARATFERLRRNVGRGQGRIGRATGARRRGVGTTRPGSGGCCRMASAFPNPADAWATTWTRILDHCANVNGAPFYTHTAAPVLGPRAVTLGGTVYLRMRVVSDGLESVYTPSIYNIQIIYPAASYLNQYERPKRAERRAQG